MSSACASQPTSWSITHDLWKCLLRTAMVSQLLALTEQLGVRSICAKRLYPTSMSQDLMSCAGM